MGVVLGSAKDLEGSWWVATGTSVQHDGEGDPIEFRPGSREFKSARCLSKLTYFYACHVVLVTAAEIREMPTAGSCTPEKYRQLREMAREKMDTFVPPFALQPAPRASSEDSPEGPRPKRN